MRRLRSSFAVGAGNYGFKLTAIDGQASGGGGTDTIRLKIWDKDNGDVVVYDSGLGAEDDEEPTMRTLSSPTWTVRHGTNC